MTTLFLHIGSAKTGTTSIQKFLKRNRHRLASKHDIALPNVLSDGRAAAMYYYAAGKIGHRKREKLAVQSREEFNKAYEARFDRLATTLDTGSAVCVNELLFSMEPQAVLRLHEILGRVFSDIRIYMYLRRQDLLEVSVYLQAFKGGYDTAARFNQVLRPRVRRYLAVVDTWSEVFGPENVSVYAYKDAIEADGNVIPHFLRSIGVDDLSDLAMPESLNSSWGLNQARAARFLRDSLRPGNPELIKRVVGTLASGPRYPASRAEARDFVERFAAENETMRRRFFPHKKALFDDDFSMYPENFDIDAFELEPGPDEILARFRAMQTSE